MKEEDSGAILVYRKGNIGCGNANQSVKPGKDGMHPTDVATEWGLFTANKKFFFPMVTILLMGETRFDAPNKVWILKEVGKGYFTFELVETGNIFNTKCNRNAVKGGLVANIFVGGSLGILGQAVAIEQADTVPVLTCFPETVTVGFGVDIVLLKVMLHVKGVGLKFIGNFFMALHFSKGGMNIGRHVGIARVVVLGITTGKKAEKRHCGMEVLLDCGRLDVLSFKGSTGSKCHGVEGKGCDAAFVREVGAIH
ncbi:unnamed protein product [Cylindrotheca closterium]|uniref:Uncharacterized protein n=1 Tax=Cylindrotheca closterium TaxID=2856 RepID=A0AAD2CNQ7_9STRA|nr:unnamed protein product [Cylindrotheca closterium]